jgi:hypothetical protein
VSTSSSTTARPGESAEHGLAAGDNQHAWLERAQPLIGGAHPLAGLCPAPDLVPPTAPRQEARPAGGEALHDLIPGRQREIRSRPWAARHPPTGCRGRPRPRSTQAASRARVRAPYVQGARPRGPSDRPTPELEVDLRSRARAVALLAGRHTGAWTSWRSASAASKRRSSSRPFAATAAGQTAFEWARSASCCVAEHPARCHPAGRGPTDAGGDSDVGGPLGVCSACAVEGGRPTIRECKRSVETGSRCAIASTHTGPAPKPASAPALVAARAAGVARPPPAPAAPGRRPIPRREAGRTGSPLRRTPAARDVIAARPGGATTDRARSAAAAGRLEVRLAQPNATHPFECVAWRLLVASRQAGS